MTATVLTASERALWDSIQAYHHAQLVKRLTEQAHRAGWGLLERQDGTFLAGNGGKVVELKHTIDVAVFLELLAIPANTAH